MKYDSVKKKVYNVRIAIVVAIVLYIPIWLFACSGHLQDANSDNEVKVVKTRSTEEIINETETINQHNTFDSKEIRVVYNRDISNSGINIKGYKQFVEIRAAIFYNKDDNTWSDGSLESKGLQEVFIRGVHIVEKEYGTINISNYVKKIEDKILLSNYIDREEINLSEDQFYSDDLNYIVDGNKKIICEDVELVFDKESRKTNYVLIFGYLLLK